MQLKLQRLIDDLSEQEKEHFQELIEECKQREIDLIEYGDVIKICVSAFVENLKVIAINMNKIEIEHEKMQKLTLSIRSPINILEI